MIHIKALDGRTPIGNVHFIVNPEGFEPELLHPRGIVLFLGELFHDLRRQAGFHAVCVVLLVPDVVDAAVHVLHIGFSFQICHVQSLPIQSSVQAAKTLFVDLIHQFFAAVADDDALFHHMGRVHMVALPEYGWSG